MSPRVVTKRAWRMQFSLDNYSHTKFSVISNDTITTLPQLFLKFSFFSALLTSRYCKSTPCTWKLTQRGLRIKGKFEMFEPKNLRLGVLAPRFVLYPNSEPEKSHTSQTLIFSGHLDMTWAVLVKEFEIWQNLSQRRGGHKFWVTQYKCSWILSSPPPWLKWSQISNFLAGLGSLVSKWPKKAKILLIRLYLGSELSK